MLDLAFAVADDFVTGPQIVGLPQVCVAEPEAPLVEDALALTSGLLCDPQQTCILRVAGDGLADALLNEGDIVLLNTVAEVHEGDLVAAHVIDEGGQGAIAVGHYHGAQGGVYLQPVRPGAPSRLYRSERVTLQGKVVMVIRQAA